MNSIVFSSNFIRRCGQDAMVTFDLIAVSFEVNHVMHSLFTMVGIVYVLC